MEKDSLSPNISKLVPELGVKVWTPLFLQGENEFQLTPSEEGEEGEPEKLKKVVEVWCSGSSS